MKIVSVGDNLHETPKLVFWKKNDKNILKCHLLKFLPSMLNFKCYCLERKSDIALQQIDFCYKQLLKYLYIYIHTLRSMDTS